MPTKALDARKKALEESFFEVGKTNRAKRQRIQQLAATKGALAELSGIQDDAVLERLIALDVEPDTWAALSLIPLVEVAWADGKVQQNERRAILAGAQANGLAQGSTSYERLESWLERTPNPGLLECWCQYIAAVSQQLSTRERNVLKSEILGRARAVAEVAGGILGMGNKVSKEEEKVLKDLEKAFEDGDRIPKS